ncbi:polysaccharide deacetylase family protein [Leeia oryzae]|uniref:polysaccharide deacetylase family protein n=1 Tax=Leeia oryzae TaxID=356662 RepID=UPI00036BEFA1|nr:polysaccharide deacetylase family protein [Leeia oryzae]
MNRWRPTPFLWVCIVAHLPLLVWAWRVPAQWPWWLGALLLVHGGIAMAGLWPRSRLLGQNLICLPPAATAAGEVALTFDDGPDPEVTPRILAILARYEVKATFFCIGERALQYPELCRQILAAGHEIENHGQRHRVPTAFSGPRGWRREVMDGVATLTRLTGQRPRFYRPIAGLRNPFLAPLLAREGLLLACWTRRGYDTREKNADRMLARLTRRLAAGDILLMHDGHAARDASGQPVLLTVLPRVLDIVAARGLTPVTLRQGCRA